MLNSIAGNSVKAFQSEGTINVTEPFLNKNWFPTLMRIYSHFGNTESSGLDSCEIVELQLPSVSFSGGKTLNYH